MLVTALIIGNGEAPKNVLQKHGYKYEILPHTEEDDILMSRKTGKCRSVATGCGVDFSNSVVPTFGIIKNKQWHGLIPKKSQKYIQMDSEGKEWAKQFWDIAENIDEDMRVRAVRLKLTKI
jgi:hypothetical protein